jgi:6-phosphogluconolactonase (cycloisomerase 2 family)
MPSHLPVSIERLARLSAALVLTLGVVGLAPVPQPVLAAPPAVAAEAPALGLLPSPVPTIIVATTTIADDAGDGQCDLWEAMQASFLADFDATPTYHECTAALGGANVIGFIGPAAGGTIQIPKTVHSGDLPFAWGDLTILGPITIKPSAALTDTHLLRLSNDANLTLIAVTLSNAHTSGGGAAILDTNHATINIIGSNIAGNIADNDGGAINSDGNVNVTLSNFSGNEALGIQPGTGFGGGINVTGAGSLNIAKSNFAGNTAKAGGGAIYSTSANGVIADSLFSGNIGGQDINLNKGGGAVYNDVNGALSIARTQFAGNLAPQGNGGAVYNNSGATLVISDTTFAANLAGDPSHATLGGAIYNQYFLNIYRSSLANNISVQGDGGGLAVDSAGTADVANTTFVANGAPNGFGGAVVVTQTQAGGPASTFIARNVTIATNAAKLPSNHGGGIFVGPGQNLTLGNTILDGNISGNCAGAINLNSPSHNLDSGTSCNLPNSNGNINSGSADLGGPSFNGGPISSMLTMKPNYGSDAIDAGDPAMCAAQPVNNEDQRGETRPKDGTNPGNLSPICDIGAYEADGPKPGYGSDPSEPGPINVGNTQTSTTVTTTLVVSNTGDFLLTITPSALTGSNPGDFSVPLSIINIPKGGAPHNIVISCTPSATGPRSALMGMATTDVPLHAVVGYLLKCNGFAAPAAGFSSSPILPGPITFPNTVLGDSSSQTIKVFETGDATLNVNHNPLSGANPGDFSVSGDTFSITNGGAAHDITVQCAPLAVGLRSAKLTLSTNDATQSSVVYNLSCKGVPLPSPFLVPGSSIGNTPDHGLNGVFGVAVSPNGKYVYSAGNTDGKVSSFNRDPVSGALTFINWIHDGFLNTLNSAILLAVSPDGNNAYVAGQAGSVIDKLTADPATGAMSFLNAQIYPRADLAGAHGVAASPDGRSIYATGYLSNSVVAFSRNLATGNLTYVQTVISATALGGTEGLTVSPDGQNVYVTGSPDINHGTLEVFRRSTADGHLSHVQTRKQGDTIDGPSLDGLKGAYQVSVSPDGQNVYAVGANSNAIVAFSRNIADGRLHWLATYANGASGISGLNAPLGIDTTPDGLHVVASGYSAQSVAVFDRDPDNGFLTFNQEVHRNGSGNPPLNGALDVRASPDSRNIYVSAFVDNAIAVLRAANPVPVIDNINPAGVIKDASNVVMTVNGSNFIPGAFVKVGVVNQPATYLNSHQLQVDMSSYVHSVGAVTIKAFNPAPGGGLSNGVTFTVNDVGQNPVPSIDHVTPQGSLAGGNALTLDVFGASFINGSTVRWNGVNRTTTFINSGHLQAAIPQSDVSQPGTSSVTVATGGPGGGTSNQVAFTVAQPGQNAAPSITSINPVWVFSYGAASKQIKMTVAGAGHNFIQGSTVRLDGASRPTKFIDDNHLQVTIFGSDLISPGSVGITVFTPTPGGGTSNALTFTIRKWYPLYLPFMRK